MWTDPNDTSIEWLPMFEKNGVTAVKKVENSHIICGKRRSYITIY